MARTTTGIIRAVRTGLAVTLVLAGAVSVGGADAAAATRPSCAVRSSASPATVLVGAAYVVKGTVTRAGAGRRVVLQQRSGRRWHTVATTRLSRASRFHFERSAPGSRSTMTLRVFVPAAGTAGSCAGAAMSVHVTPTAYRVGVRASTGEAPRDGWFRIDGDVWPPAAGAAVDLEVRRGGRWRPVRSATLSAASSFDFRVSEDVLARYRFRVAEPASAWVAAGTSDSVVVVVTDDTLRPGERLRAGGYLRSAGGRYQLVMQPDGDLVEQVASSGRQVWSTGTSGRPGACALMQPDGDLVVERSGHTLWRSGTPGNYGARAVLQRDGQVGVYSAGGDVRWSSLTRDHLLAGGETLAADDVVDSASGRFRLTAQADGNLVLYDATSGQAMWASATDGHPGAHAVMQGDGNLVVYAAGAALWSTGTDGHPGARLDVRDDGDLVLYASDGTPVWSSGTAPPARPVDDYPWRTAICANTRSAHGYCSSSTWLLHEDAYDPYGFGYRTDASWVAWRLDRVNGLPFREGMAARYWGVPARWADLARGLGYRVDHRPARGAVALLGTGAATAAAWVASVNRDGSVTVERYDGGSYARASVAAGTPVYLHLLDLP